jgi:hypothetical protein
VAQINPALIIIDTLQLMVRVKDLNDYAQVCIALEPLLAIARRSGAHLMLVHHARKGRTDDDGDSVLGSTALFGSMDTSLTLSKRGRCRCLKTQQRYGQAIEDTVLILDPETRVPRLQGSREEFEGGEMEGKILSALGSATESLTEPEVNGLVSGRTTYKRIALRHLANSGRLVRTGNGTRGDPYRYSRSDAGTEDSPDPVSRSLVPIKVREQETSNGGSPTLEFPESDSCSLVPAPVGEQGNKQTGNADPSTAPEPSTPSDASEGGQS